MVELEPKLPADLATALRTESNRALRAGAFYGMGLAAIPVIALPIFMQLGLGRELFAAWIFAVLGGAFSGLVYVLARRDQIHGPVAWVVLVPFVSLPTIFLFVGGLVAPQETALAISGPFTFIYCLALIATGFVFEFRLSAVCGLVAATGYIGVYLFLRDQLLALAAVDGTLLAGTISDSVFAARAVIICCCGLVVAGLALVARRLMLRAIVDEREKALVSRLFGDYVSDDVKQKLLDDPAAQRGETKEVVVLFSDIRNFGALSEAAEPAQVVVRLNEYLDTMADAITSHGGVIDKFIGDAVMAVFGGVLELGNPCTSAVLAAQEMQRRLFALNERWQSHTLPPLQVGIGLHVGKVLQGAIGSRHRKDLTVIGDAVNLASRIESMTKDRNEPILITADVQRRLPPDLRARCVPLASLKLKGRQGEVALFGLREADLSLSANVPATRDVN